MHSMFLFFQVEYEVAPDDKRQEEAKEVYEKYLDPKVVLNAGLQITLKLQGPCGPLTDQVLLAHIDILGPHFQ